MESRSALDESVFWPKAPPIKMQGIKTKLIPFIRQNIDWSGKGRWIEPFLGSGTVLFNISPDRAFVADTNKHVIAFYKQIQKAEITSDSARSFLEREGAILRQKGQKHYYGIRERFNAHHDPLDFLFLNRACFNGLMRFNSKGGFNTPFCRKPERFRPAYITKICNQINWVSQLVSARDWEFVCADWKETLIKTDKDDFVYADPPYAGRFTDYFNQWSTQDSLDLENRLKELPCSFLYSMWAENKYRRNNGLYKMFSEYEIRTYDHFYHLGSTEKLRNTMTEALVVG